MNARVPQQAKTPPKPSPDSGRAGSRQRRPESRTREAPPIVHEVLSSPGQLLDPGMRTFMNSRFGHDFSRVRVHHDGKAAASARAVNASAYTVDRDIVFGAGTYAPETVAGRRLLAHELAHVVQQSGSSTAASDHLAVGHADSRLEREADSVARRVASGMSRGPVTPEPATLRRQDEPIEVDLAPSSPEEVEMARKLGITLPSVSRETWRAIGGVSDNAGQPLSEAEKSKISTLLKIKAPASSPLVSKQGPKFVLHDTAGMLGRSALAKEKAEGRGPLGKGVTAWVPRTDPAVIARPDFYETRRPTTTEYERARDIIEQPQREAAFRKVWQATSPGEQTSALDRALADQGLTPAELADEKKNAAEQLKATSGMIYTTASWAVGEICARVAAVGAKAVAVAPDKEADLTDGCKTLATYYTERNERVGSIVTVEISQASGLKSQEEKANKNACDPKNPNLAPLPKPAYTDNQYTNLVLLYLQAALLAGRFPEITTHFVVDAFIRGHCDPRCFDLMHLYDLIAATLGHGKGSTYGVKPSYGTTYGKNTVWWDDTICGGPHS